MNLKLFVKQTIKLVTAFVTFSAIVAASHAQENQRQGASEKSIAELIKYHSECDSRNITHDCFNYDPSLDMSHSYYVVKEITDVATYKKVDFALIDKSFLKMRRQMILDRNKNTNYDNYEQLQKSASPRANRLLCKAHLTQIVKRIDAAIKLSAASGKTLFETDGLMSTVLDTFGKFGREFMYSFNFGSVGMYDACNDLLYLDLLDKHSNTKQNVKLQYCTAHLRSPNWFNSTFTRRIHRVPLGICIPETCSTSSASENIQLVDAIIKSSLPRFYQDFYTQSVYCEPHKDSQLRDWTQNSASVYLFAFVSCWLGVTCVATFLNNTTSFEDTRLGFFLSAFDFRRNLTRLFTVRESKEQKVNKTRNTNETVEDNNALSDVDSGVKPLSLEKLDGIKIACSLCVISGHTLMGMSSVQKDYMGGHNFLSSMYSLYTVLPTVAVNSFFAITGVLTSNILLKKDAKTLLNPLFWLFFVIIRYVRITSILALSIWFMKEGYKYLGNGPFWDFGTSVDSQQYRCEMSSWSDVFFAQANKKSPVDSCLWPIWYLSNDLLFALLTPFLIIPYTKGNKKALVFTAIALLYIGYTSFIDIYSHNFYYEGLLDSQAETPQVFYHELGKIYTAPLYRLAPYLSGMYIGLCLHEYQIGKFNPSQSFIKIINYTSVSLFATLVSLPVMTHYLPKNKVWGTVYIILLQLLSSTNASTISSTLVSSNFDALAKYTTNKLFSILSRCALSSLLIHNIVIFYYFGSVRHQMNISWDSYIGVFSIVLMLTYTASFVVTALFEAPIKRICDKAIETLMAASIRRDKLDSNYKAKQQ